MNAIGRDANSILCLARGGAGPVVETVLRQVARVAGCSSRLWVQPALRAAGARPGDGQSPLPPCPAPDPVLAAAALAARVLTHLGLYGVADAIMTGAVRRSWPDLRARAALLPGASLPSILSPSEQLPGPEPGRVLYHCFGATHSSVVGAAIHCGILRRGGPVTSLEVATVPGFDRRASSDIGHAFYVGRDERGCEAFAIGFDGARGILTRASLDLLELMGPCPRHVLPADTLSVVSPLVRIGGYLSRRWSVVTIGRRIAAVGIAASARDLQAVVADARLAVRKQEQRTGGRPLAQVGCDNEADGR